MAILISSNLSQVFGSEVSDLFLSGYMRHQFFRICFEIHFGIGTILFLELGGYFLKPDPEDKRRKKCVFHSHLRKISKRTNSEFLA